VKKLLLDECIPRKFKNHLSGHECLTVPEAGWAGKKNGELLSLAENAIFEVFISLDQGIEYQQNLTGRNISVGRRKVSAYILEKAGPRRAVVCMSSIVRHGSC